MKRSILALTAAAAVCLGAMPVKAADPIPQLNGITVSFDEDAEIFPGLWALPTEADGSWNMKFYMNPASCTFFSGVPYEDVYYATRYTTSYGTILTYVVAFAMDSDPEAGWGDWTNTHDATYLPYDLTYNPYDHRIYGFFSNAKADGVVFATAEYEHDNNSKIHAIKNMDGSWVAIAAAADGTIYGIEATVDTSASNPVVTGSTLYKVDRLTGAVTRIGDTGQHPLLAGSATIDPRSGRMFWTVSPSASESYLCEVDLSTGAATKLFDFTDSRHVVGIYADVPEVEDKAPAAITDATATCTGGTLDGTVSFTAPATCFDGTAASGTLTYRIFDGGDLLAEGTTAPGAGVSAPVTFNARGAHNLVVYTLNGAGASLKTHVAVFAGYGMPAAPQNVKATAAGTAVTITWDAVTEAADEGYLDPADVRYTVTETTTGTVVAQSISATTAGYTATIDGITTLIFSVAADNHGILSEAGTSNKLTLGSITPPYAVGFDSADDATNFTILDCNGDGKEWTFYTDRMRMGYNSSLAMDDWLITPPLHLEAGKTYYASFKARSENDRYPEKVEARWGAAPTPEAMANVLVETQTLPKDYVELGGFITPAVTGDYYLGIHGVSDKDCYYLNVDDISIAAGISANAPEAPTGLAVELDPSGDPKAIVKLTAPAKTLAGTTLAALTKIEVYRSGVDAPVHTFTNPTPGTELSFTDVLPEAATVTYTARPFSAEGEGNPASVTAFVGMPLAAAPESVTIVEGEPGMITLCWDKVAVSADGDPINPDKVKYNIYTLTTTEGFWGPVETEELMEAGITDNVYAFRAVPEGEQNIVGYSVSAVTDFGETAHTFTEKIAAGTPYTDYTESWAAGNASTIITTESINYGNWSVESGDYSTPVSQDGDGGFMVMRGYFAGYCGALTTGKISLEDIAHPQFCFYSYTPDDEGADLNTIAISVREIGGEWAEVWNKTIVDMGATTGWHRVDVPLSGFGGKIVQIRMLATVHDRPYTQISIDNLSIGSMLGIDLEITDVTAPEYAKAGRPFNVIVNYVNNGVATAEGHTVSLLDADGNVVASAEGEPVGLLATGTARLTAVMPADASEEVFYHATVAHNDDERADNDDSDVFTIIPVASGLPAPEALKATDSAEGVVLAWDAPSMDAAPATPFTEDFESHTAWAHTSDSWFFIDVDKRPLGGFDTDIPAIVPGQPASFFVFDTSDKFNGVASFTAQSGEKYIAAAYCTGSGNTDDWAVSPALSGDAQTISFYARSYSTQYPERIEVLYSTGSLNTADFLPTACVIEAVAGTWTRYEAELPAGAVHFAIRSCSDDPFFVMVDDITFTPASSYGLTVDGYNIYRDGVKVNDAPLAATGYTDTVDDPEAHIWTVSAVYADGESGMSNEAQAEESGISDAIAAGIRIEARSGRIIVSGADGHNLTVSAADGVLLYNAAATDRTEIEATTGIYIVKAGPKVAKVAVR